MDEILVIQNTIYEFRGYKVMLDSDLSRLYEVETRVLNQAVKRNSTRFPIDFMFQVTGKEWETLISQFVISKTMERRGGRQKLPYAFTEQGVAMLSSVINSERAIAVNIQIMRVFSQMRQYALVQGNTNERIADLRQLLLLHIPILTRFRCKKLRTFSGFFFKKCPNLPRRILYIMHERTKIFCTD